MTFDEMPAQDLPWSVVSPLHLTPSHDMRPFRLTLKNYRCFEDSSPLIVDIGPGITALVGPNNAGKSTLLKFFYEMRLLLEEIANEDVLALWLRGGSRAINAQGVDDQLEIFHNENRRDLEISIDFLTNRDDEVGSITLRAERKEPSLWRGELKNGQNMRATEFRDRNENAFVLESGRIVKLNLDALIELRDLASRVFYIGPHRSAVGQSSGTYYDLAIGSTFITQWNQWKTGASRRQNDAALQVSNDIARILGFRSIEINSTGNNNLQVIVDGKPLYLRELGSGIAQFIVVLGNVLVREPSLLLIDEPEIHLHPSLQSDFLLTVAERASYGLVFATHSLGLARANASPLYSFRREGSRSLVRPYEQTTDFREFLGEMSFGSFQELGCNTVLLVEGVNEVKAGQALLRVFGRDHTVVVLPMGGDQFFSQNREAELAELLRLTPNVAVLIDSERSGPGIEIPEPRKSFLQRCVEMGFQTHATDRRAFENYLTTEALQAAFGPSHSALTEFEALKSHPKPWSKAANWRAARHMKREDLENTDLGRFLATLR